LGGLSLSHTNLNRIPFRDEHITGNGKHPWGVGGRLRPAGRPQLTTMKFPLPWLYSILLMKK